MRSRYRINDADAAYFVTATIVAWLPVLTTAARCDILVESLEYCRAHKGLKIRAWVILDNHFHAILAAPDLSRVPADLKRHTAQRILELLETETLRVAVESAPVFPRGAQGGERASGVAGGIASAGDRER